MKLCRSPTYLEKILKKEYVDLLCIREEGKKPG
jgi:hypothetical protein